MLLLLYIADMLYLYCKVKVLNARFCLNIIKNA